MLGMRKVRTERFLAGGRIALAALLMGMPLVAGCSKEVPYVAPDNGAPEKGAPTTEEQQPSEQASGEEEAPAFTPEPTTPEQPVAETAESPSGGLPWEAGEKQEAAPELFAGVEKPAEGIVREGAVKPQAAEKKDGDDEDAVGAFLEEAYGSVAEGPERAESEPAAPGPDVTASVVTEEVAPTEGAPAEEAIPPAVTLPADAAPEPKAPSAIDSSPSDLMKELWGEEKPEEPALAAEEPVEEQVEESSRGAAPMLPFDEPAAPVEEGASLFDEPEVEATPEVESQSEGDEEESLPAPEVGAAKPQAGGRAAPMAADGMKPLPAVPVLEFNTRHLAWLLGGKLGLAELADLDGATPTEVAEWRREVERLAKSLKIADPSTGGAAATSDQRVKDMLDAAARCGSELKRAHGVDHAALMEIALKTNALLVVAQDHPELAASVGRAVEDAAGRAMLPKFLWEDSVRVLKKSPDADQAHDAVVRLHQDVERFLR